MAVLLALLSALAYGTSDFLGGLVSRRTGAWSVAVVVQASAMVSTFAAAGFVGGSPTLDDLAWGALAGVGSGTGVGFLFRGLSSGRMSVVAPLSAVGSALVPVGVALSLGERPGLWVGVAVMLALPGIWLVAGEASDPAGGPRPAGRRSSGVLDGALAGLGFGAMFAALGQVPDGAGLWPLGLTQTASTLTVVGLATVLGAPWRPAGTAFWALPAGPLGALAVIAFQLAAQSGLLTVAAVLAALYPAATILLAVLVLHERVHRRQGIGLLLCAGTVALVSLR